jgi:excinuclease ABC subunit B
VHLPIFHSSHWAPETNRRRKIQEEYNTKNNITPVTIIKNLQNPLYKAEEMDYYDVKVASPEEPLLDEKQLPKEISKLEKLMKKAAKDLDFEQAALIRDKLLTLKKMQVMS